MQNQKNIIYFINAVLKNCVSLVMAYVITWGIFSIACLEGDTTLFEDIVSLLYEASSSQLNASQLYEALIAIKKAVRLVAFVIATLLVFLRFPFDNGKKTAVSALKWILACLIMWLLPSDTLVLGGVVVFSVAWNLVVCGLYENHIQLQNTEEYTNRD